MIEITQNLAAALFLAVPFCLLWMTVNRKAGEPLFSPAAVLAAYPLYFFFQVLLMKILNLLHLLNSGGTLSAHLLADAGLLFAFFRLKSRPARTKREMDEEPPAFLWQAILWSAGTILLLTSLAVLLTPLFVNDVNVYHMPMVANYFQNQSLAPWATQCLRQITRPNAAELQALNLALVSRSDAWMELPQILALFVALAAVFEMGKLLLGQTRLALLSIAFVLTAPQIFLGTISAKNDVILMALILCSFYWVIRLTIDSGSRRWKGIVVLGLCAALACATKVLGICLFTAVFAVLLLLVLIKKLPAASLGTFFTSGVLFLVVLAGGLYWTNFTQTGIPFGIDAVEIEASDFFSGASIPQSIFQLYLYELSFWRPFLMKGKMNYGVSHYGYLFPLLLALGLGAIVCQFLNLKRMRKKGLWTLASLTVIFFISLTAYRRTWYYDQRFMIWMVPCLGLLTLSFFQKMKVRTSSILGILLSLFAVFNFAYTCHASVFKRVIERSVNYFLTHHELARNTDIFSERWGKSRFGAYPVLEKEAKASDWVLYVGGRKSMMYPCWGKRFSRRVDGVRDLPDALEKIRSGKYRFLVVERGAELNLRDEALKTAESLDYTRIAKSYSRVLYKRPEPSQD